MLLGKEIEAPHKPKLAELSEQESDFLKERKNEATEVPAKEDHFLNW